MSRADATGSGLPRWAFGIDVDQTHLHGAQRIGQLALAAIAFVAKPRAFGTPIELFWLPGIGTAAGEAEGLEAHRLERDVADENIEIGPGDLGAVFLFDWPEEASRLVEIGIVGPAVQGREALLSAARSAAAIGDTVGAGAMPGQPNEQTAVVAEVGWPPVLRVGHESVQILDHRIEVEALEFRCVVEGVAHRIGRW